MQCIMHYELILYEPQSMIDKKYSTFFSVCQTLDKVFCQEDGREKNIKSGAVVFDQPRRFIRRLHNDDIHFFEFFFQGFGESVVSDENVYVFRMRERVRHNFADLGRVEHHIYEFRFFPNEF